LTLVDTNVLLDVVNETEHWADWAEGALARASLRGPVWINDVIYAEFSVRYAAMAAAEAALDDVGIELLPMPRQALFLAGKAFLKYRRTGGVRTGVLPDFFIGAHAAAAGLPLLTRDARRYRTYFPAIELIAPDN
jgi:predicted nucleic acid-binding protein